ncbi:MAG: hypothetical protein IPP67_00340 [Rhodospirillaceae bacterium]|nr:hypothetical protein [Rhodospirillaceae bacterium]
MQIARIATVWITSSLREISSDSVIKEPIFIYGIFEHAYFATKSFIEQVPLYREAVTALGIIIKIKNYFSDAHPWALLEFRPLN